MAESQLELEARGSRSISIMIIVVISIHDSVNGGFFSMALFEDFQRWQGSAWVLALNGPAIVR
jgi:hypothetical protein|tara:strand:- start:1833 stop:2021 length:189 start_codon:yes stop_codon:yes gene_type:complete